MFERMGGWWRLWVVFTCIWVPTAAYLGWGMVGRERTFLEYALLVISYPVIFVLIGQAYLWVRQGFRATKRP